MHSATLELLSSVFRALWIALPICTRMHSAACVWATAFVLFSHHHHAFCELTVLCRSKQQKKIPSGGRPAYWKRYGPLGGLVPLGAKGELACPPAIVAARAFVAGLPPVQELRPKVSLPDHSLAIYPPTVGHSPAPHARLWNLLLIPKFPTRGQVVLGCKCCCLSASTCCCLSASS